MKKTLIGTAVMLLMTSVAGASAQEAPILWNSPTFMAPHPGSDLGVYLVDTDGADLGFHGVWRTDGNMNLGLRAGYLDTPGDGVLLFGAETWGDIAVQDADFPLDLAWTAGAGASVNGSTIVGIPVGVSFGRTIDLEDSISFQLYGHPRIGLAIFENAADDLELDLEGQFDLGADFYLSQDVTLRIGVTLGDFDALGIGVAFRQ